MTAATEPAEQTAERDRWAATVREWWQDLDEDRGGRAQLRRCRDVTEVYFCPAFHGLLRRLGVKGGQQSGVLAVIAGVLSHVKEDAPSGPRFAVQMAQDRGERAPVSELRFRALLEKADRENLFMPLIRVIGVMRGAANVADLARSIRYWGPRVRREWACDYYANAPER
jgi:CRISPR system Cascade subunit CasB